MNDYILYRNEHFTKTVYWNKKLINHAKDKIIREFNSYINYFFYGSQVQMYFNLELKFQPMKLKCCRFYAKYMRKWERAYGGMWLMANQLLEIVATYLNNGYYFFAATYFRIFFRARFNHYLILIIFSDFPKNLQKSVMSCKPVFKGKYI